MLFQASSTLGFIGFIASVVSHIFGLLGYPSPFGNWAWVLHVGIFPLFIPLVLFANKTVPKNADQGNFTHLMKEVPSSIRIIFIGLFLYTMLNFGLFIHQMSKYPRNQVPDWLTQRGFSGHWMVFYFSIFWGYWGLYLLSKRDEG
jgi:hypothetical protein